MLKLLHDICTAGTEYAPCVSTFWPPKHHQQKINSQHARPSSRMLVVSIFRPWTAATVTSQSRELARGLSKMATRRFGQKHAATLQLRRQYRNYTLPNRSLPDSSHCSSFFRDWFLLGLRHFVVQSITGSLLASLQVA